MYVCIYIYIYAYTYGLVVHYIILLLYDVIVYVFISYSGFSTYEAREATIRALAGPDAARPNSYPRTLNHHYVNIYIYIYIHIIYIYIYRYLRIYELMLILIVITTYIHMYPSLL